MQNSFNVRLRLPPIPRYARSARAALAAFGAYHGIDAFDLENLTFALGEALANAIAHADTHDDIDVGFCIDDATIVATVSDKGRGFAGGVRALGETVPLPLDSSEVGRGVAIMQRCTDFFDVQSVPGEGTTVTLGRYRTTPAKVTALRTRPAR